MIVFDTLYYYLVNIYGLFYMIFASMFGGIFKLFGITL